MKKGLLFTGLVLAVGGVGFYFYYKNKNKKRVIEVPKITIIPGQKRASMDKIKNLK